MTNTSEDTVPAKRYDLWSMRPVSILSAKHKRPEGQNLWGRPKSAVAVEVAADEVVGPAGGSTRLSFQSFSGQSREFLWTSADHVDQRPHHVDQPLVSAFLETYN